MVIVIRGLMGPWSRVSEGRYRPEGVDDLELMRCCSTCAARPEPHAGPNLTRSHGDDLPVS